MTYYIIRRYNAYHEIVSGAGLRSVKEVVYSTPYANDIIEIRKAKRKEVEDYLERGNDIRAIDRQLYWHQKRKT